jgi:hypothetical protein
LVWPVIGLAAVVLAAGSAPAPSAVETGTALPHFRAGKAVARISRGGFVSQLAVADLNGDGRPDLIATSSAFQSQQTFPVTVLVNDRRGGFVDHTQSLFSGDVPVTQNARELVVADFNGDRRPDVFIADHGDDRAPFPGFMNTLILSAPGGRLVDASGNLPLASDFTHSATAGDVNGDGSVDLYVGNIYGANRVPPRILLNDGSGHFRVGDGLLPAAQTDIDQNRYTSSLFVDVNGDGKLDLVLGAEDHTPSSVVLLNDGAGHFHVLPNALPPKPFVANAIALDIASLEINGDTHPDLLIAFTKGDPFYVGRWIQVLINNGNGTFRDETATRLPQFDNNNAWPIFLEPLDLDRTGTLDFVVHLGGDGEPPPFYLSGPNGTFHSAAVAVPPGRLWAFVDTNGDNQPDLVTVDPSSGTVYVAPQQASVTKPKLHKCKKGQRPTKRKPCKR